MPKDFFAQKPGTFVASASPLNAKPDSIQSPAVSDQIKAERGSSQTRLRYKVQRGETIEDIARERLGDERLVPLIVTINRSTLNYHVVDGQRRAYVVADQFVWLPCRDEIETFTKHLIAFTRNPAFAQSQPGQPHSSGAMSLLQVATQMFQNWSTSSNASNHDEFDPPHSADPAPTKPDLEFTPEITERRCYRVGLGETLKSVALRDPAMQDERFWRLLASLNGLPVETDPQGNPVAHLVRGQYIVLPNQTEIAEFQILDRLARAAHGHSSRQRRAEDHKPIDCTPHSQGAVREWCEDLSDYCRLVVRQEPRGFSVMLEANMMQRWIGLASYSTSGGRTVRSIVCPFKAVEDMTVDLPIDVAFQLAREDFRRNWHLYYNAYFIQQHPA